MIKIEIKGLDKLINNIHNPLRANIIAKLCIRYLYAFGVVGEMHEFIKKKCQL